MFRFIKLIPANSLILLVRMYQRVLSPWIGKNCRFTPSCSTYMIQAVKKHGAVKGCCKGMYRIARCNPWGGSGHDPP